MESIEPHLNHYPDKIGYYVIQDESVALIALKNGEIDVLSGVPPSDFSLMAEDKTYKSQFHFLAPNSYQFVYLGFNARLEKLNLPMRKALSHLIPYEDIIEVAALGFGQRTVGPMNPVDSLYYNSDVELTNFNPKKSENLMIQSGYRRDKNQWYNLNNEQLSLTLNYQTGSAINESIALIINDRLKKFGIDVHLRGLDRSLLIKRAKSHDFEIILSSFRGGPLAHNFAPLFGTDAAIPGGLNYTGFGSQQSDSVINLINYAEKKEQKVSGLKELQRLLHEERTMLFLFFQKERIIVSKRFSNVFGFSRKPGYNVTKFQLANPN